MKTVAIIQARMSSARVPGKVLCDLEGQPVLHRVVERVRRANSFDAAVVATSEDPSDDPVARFCEQAGVECFRGSLEDVLDRYYQAAGHFGAEVIGRLTADCPLLDPQVIALVVQTYRQGGYDYVSNALEHTYPDGLDTEVFSFQALQQAWRQARWKSEREHVTPYVWKHAELFRLGSVRHSEDLSSLRWTVDQPEDLEFVRAVYRGCGPGPFGMAEVLRLLREQPHLAEINQRFGRNEGYAKSLREDHLVNSSEAS